MAVRPVVLKNPQPAPAPETEQPQLFDTHPEVRLDFTHVRDALKQGYSKPFLLIDTEIAGDERPVIHIRVEKVTPQRNAVADDFSHGSGVLSGKPSLKGLETMVGAYGFQLERLSDWAGLTRGMTALKRRTLVRTIPVSTSRNGRV